MLYKKIMLQSNKLLIYISILFAISIMMVPQSLSAQDEPKPRLSLTSSSELHVDADNNDEASVGDTLIYHVTIQNDGDAAATVVRFLSKLDEHLTLIGDSITSSQGSVRAGGFVQVELGELAAGESATIDFQATVDVGSASGQVRTTTQISFAEDNQPPDETGGLSQGETLVVTPVEVQETPEFMIYLPFINAGR